MIRRATILILTLAAVGSVPLWWMSDQRHEATLYRDLNAASTFMVVIDDGQLRVSHWLSTKPPASTYDRGFERWRFGFEATVNITPDNRVNRMHRVMLPMWAVVALLGAYPLLALGRGPIRRWRRRRFGLCPDCGYRLIGNTSGVCPECGRAVSPQIDKASPVPNATWIERVVWTALRRVSRPTVLVGVAIAIAVVYAAVQLIERATETPMKLTYRVCGDCGLSERSVDMAIDMARSGYIAPSGQNWQSLFASMFTCNAAEKRTCHQAIAAAAKRLGPTDPWPQPPQR